jgi:hypothetical protein
MAGIASEIDAMMWLAKARQHVPEDDAPFRCAVQPRRSDELLGAQAQEAPAHHARQLCPAGQRQDQRDHEVVQRGRPVLRHRGRSRQPDRDRGQRQHQFDHALDHEVDASAVIARDAAQHDADRECQEHAHQTDGQRDLGAHHDAAVDAAPEPVGAEEEQRLARVLGGEQVDVGAEQAEHRVLVTLGKHLQVDLALAVFLVHRGQCLRVALEHIGVDVGPDRPAAFGAGCR